jgi:hypothetical protein
LHAGERAEPRDALAYLTQSRHLVGYLAMVALRALRRVHGTDFALREVHFRHRSGHLNQRSVR